MFVSFYYRLREAGLPVRMSSFLQLQKALRAGLVGGSLSRFYRVARCLLIKSETMFDLYDRVFAAHFQGVDLGELEDDLVDQLERAMRDWLNDPLAKELLSEAERNELPLDELMKRFEERLGEQTERHDGGGKWVGTGGRSPFGHSGNAKRGIRIGGGSQNRSAVKVAGERRWRDYARGQIIKQAQVGEAVKRLKQMRLAGAKTEIDVDESIRETVRQGGEIDLVFKARTQNKLKLIVMLDNGGWSMDPFIELVSQLFGHLSDQVKELRTYYFHNCIYDVVYKDPARSRGVDLEEVLRLERDWRLLIVGDASMAPEELEARGGAIYRWGGNEPPGIYWLRRLAERFPQSVWLNPIPQPVWRRAYGSYTISKIGRVFQMCDLTLDGLEAAVDHLNGTRI